MQYRFIEAISKVCPQQWNAVAGVDYPFLRHEFLLALENSGSVSAERGWQPQHLVVEQGNAIIAILPLYIKTHSYGEYVFDWAWADAYHRHGLEYYPKLVSAIPFTPATGPRLAINCNENPAELMGLISEALQNHIHKLGASGWHVLFPQQAELELWRMTQAGIRLGCQFHWYNQNFTTFDDFLATMTSRKRKDVKKERRKIAEQGLQLRQLTAEQITPEHWRWFYHCYQQTYLKKSGHGGYLTEAFFRLLHQTMPEQLLLVMAYKDDKPIAAALNLFSADTLFGRYWGAIEEVDGLHFEACYYQGIDFCIEQKLKRFDAGAQGEHKISRGFVPTLTHSMHWIEEVQFRTAIGRFLQQEREGIQQYQAEAMTILPFRADIMPTINAGKESNG